MVQQVIFIAITSIAVACYSIFVIDIASISKPADCFELVADIAAIGIGAIFLNCWAFYFLF